MATPTSPVKIVLLAAALLVAAGWVSTPTRPAAPGTDPVNNGLDAEKDTEEATSPAANGMSSDEIAARLERDMAAMKSMQMEQQKGETDREPQQARPRGIRWNNPANRPDLDEAASGTQSIALEQTDDSNTPQDPGDATADLSSEVVQEPLGNVPAEGGSLEEIRLRELMVRLSSELYQDAAYADTPLPQYLVIAAMSIVDPERALDPEAIPDLTDRDRELLKAYQNFFQTIGRDLVESGDSEALARALKQLQKSLEGEPELTIRRAALCWRVRGYGQYDEFDTYSFLVESAQQVIVYTEVEDFTSTQNANDEWVTDLSEELIIYHRRDGIPVSRQPVMSVPDVSRNRRQEFFISHLVTIPKNLSVGAYTMKIRIYDEATDSVAETGIDFNIVADASMAAKVE